MHTGGGGAGAGAAQGSGAPCMWELEEEKRQQLYVQYYEVWGTRKHGVWGMGYGVRDIRY